MNLCPVLKETLSTSQDSDGETKSAPEMRRKGGKSIPADKKCKSIGEEWARGSEAEETGEQHRGSNESGGAKSTAGRDSQRTGATLIDTEL